MDTDCHSQKDGQTDMTDADRRKGKHELITLQRRSSDLFLTVRYLKQATLISVGQHVLRTANSVQTSFIQSFSMWVSPARHETLITCNIQQQTTVRFAGTSR
jgi:hypothetical protein